MNGYDDHKNMPILEVESEEVYTVGENSLENEDLTTSVHSLEGAVTSPDTLSPIALPNGRHKHSRNPSNITSASGRTGSLDSVSLGNSNDCSSVDNQSIESPSPIDMTTLEDISLNDDDGNSESGNGRRKSLTTTSKMSLLARRLFKRNEPVVLTTNLIFENRPSNLPAKNPEEEIAQRKAYEEMVAAAKRKEVAEMKKKQRAAEERKKYEEAVAACTNIWLKEIIPEWHSTHNTRKAHSLWWKGLPPKVRGTVWKLAVGNELQLTKNLYYIMVERAKDTLKCCKEKDSNKLQHLSQEAHDNVKSIQLDVLRTFPHLCIFQESGPYHENLLNVLGAYASYRPDVGYVQGMSFLTAVLLLNTEPPDAFILLSNLLHQPCQRAFFRMDANMMFVYFDVFNLFFEESLPPLFNYFNANRLTPDLYLIGWVFTLYSKSLPLDVACRVWDVYFRDGDSFLFAVALGILRMHMSQLLQMEFEIILQFLRKLPDDLDSDLLFDNIRSIGLSPRKFQHTMIELIDMNNSERKRKQGTAATIGGGPSPIAVSSPPVT